MSRPGYKSPSGGAAAPQLTEEEMVMRMRRRHTAPDRVFRLHSSDGKSLSFGELRKAMISLGCALTSQELRDLARRYASRDRMDLSMDYHKFLGAHNLISSDRSRDWDHLNVDSEKEHASPPRLLAFDSDGLVVHINNLHPEAVAANSASTLRSPRPNMSSSLAAHLDHRATLEFGSKHYRAPLQNAKPGALDNEGGLAAWLANDVEETAQPTRPLKLPPYQLTNLDSTLSPRPDAPTKEPLSTKAPLAVHHHELYRSSFILEEPTPGGEEAPLSHFGLTPLEMLAITPLDSATGLRKVHSRTIYATSKSNLLSDTLTKVEADAAPIPPVRTGKGRLNSPSKVRAAEYDSPGDQQAARKGYSLSVAGKLRRSLRAVLARAPHSAATQLHAFLTKADTSHSGALRDVDLWHRVKLLVPEVTNNELAHTLAVVKTEAAASNPAAGHPFSSSFSTDIDIQKFTEWVLQGETSDDVLTSAELPSRPQKRPSRAPASQRLSWNNKSANFETFRREWESKWGAAARKEMASDLSRQPEGPTWTSAEPAPFKVLHLSAPPPLPSA